MSNKYPLTLVAATVFISCSAFSAPPQGYPADYQGVIDAATKEGKVVIYSTTDTRAADQGV